LHAAGEASGRLRSDRRHALPPHRAAPRHTAGRLRPDDGLPDAAQKPSLTGGPSRNRSNAAVRRHAPASRRALEFPKAGGIIRLVQRARRHQRLLSVLAFGLLALVAELVGRSLTHRLDFGRHVRSPSYAGADYYPILLAAVKVGIALLLARLAWRLVKA